MRKIFRKYLRRHGFDIVSYDPVNHPVARRLMLMGQNNIDLLLDVGANIGQYGLRTREDGYKGRIVSFEPLSSAFRKLAARTEEDANWEAVNIGLGDKDEIALINISANSQSSSILDMLPSHVSTAPDSAYIESEEVSVRRLDSIFRDYWKPGDNVFLKIDAQGYERNIIEGAAQALGHISGIQMELSLVPLYEGEALMAEMINAMSEKGYVLMSIDPTYGNPATGQMLQVDCMFFR